MTAQVYNLANKPAVYAGDPALPWSRPRINAASQSSEHRTRSTMAPHRSET